MRLCLVSCSRGTDSYEDGGLQSENSPGGGVPTASRTFKARENEAAAGRKSPPSQIPRLETFTE